MSQAATEGEPMNGNQDKLRVLLVDDRIVFREGVHSVLETEEDIEVVAEVVETEEAVSYSEILGADVVVANSRQALALQKRLLAARLVILDNTDVGPGELVQAVRGGAYPANGTQEAKQALKHHLLSRVARLTHPQGRPQGGKYDLKHLQNYATREIIREEREI